MSFPPPRILFTPWARADDEMHIRFRRSNAMGIIFTVLLHLLFAFLWLHAQKKIPRVVNQGSSSAIKLIMLPEESAPAKSAAAQPQRKPKPTPPQRRATIVTAPTNAPPLPQVPPVPEPTPTPKIEIPAPPVAETPPAPAMDMMAMLNAKRTARQAQENADGQNGRQPSPSEIATANINRNLATLSTKRDGTNGVFQVISKGTRIGQFSFNGWKSDKNNSWREVIEVDAGLLGDVELAMIKRMIELIRSHYKGDFTWDSHKLGRAITLSARQEDNEGLETFMLREFFDGRR
jgi:outer membrane biosynthesis protein TonB